MYTLQGKTRPTRHIRFPHQSTYARRMLPAGGPRTWQPSMSHDRVGWSHCYWEKELPTQSPACRPTDPWVRTQFLSRAHQWSSGESQTPINNKLLGLPGPYYRHVIGTFNTCSWGPTERSLTNTGRGYNLEGAGLPHTHSLTFPTNCLPFPLVAPPGLHFNQAAVFKPSVEF
jgi:hypothetical protein